MLYIFYILALLSLLFLIIASIVVLAIFGGKIKKGVRAAKVLTIISSVTLGLCCLAFLITLISFIVVILLI